ncbi:hypothetical protein G6F42_023858 [Rhizopus arrhizus]|nr:hypothetical protein G6F42_023858 [Rhizopus arrhizus]
MKFLTLSAVVALAACVSAKPAGHVDLAKRAIIATQTVVVDGTTEVQVIDAVEATVNAITTVVKTETVTETDATYICNLLLWR